MLHPGGTYYQVCLDVHLQRLAQQDFGKTKRGRATCVIGTAFLLHVLVCGFAVLHLTLGAHYADDLNHAADLSWLTVRTLYYSEEVVVRGDGLSEDARRRLEADIASIKTVRDDLYFGLQVTLSSAPTASIRPLIALQLFYNCQHGHWNRFPVASVCSRNRS